MTNTLLEEHLNQLVDELSDTFLSDPTETFLPDALDPTDRMEAIFSEMTDSAAPQLPEGPAPASTSPPVEIIMPRRHSDAPPPAPPLTISTSAAAPGQQQRQSLMDQLSRWGINPLLESLVAGDQELAAAALINLLRSSQSTNRHLLALTKKPAASPVEQGSAMYVSHLVGLKFVYVPPGTFLMGSDPATDPLAEPNEQPQHRLNLPGFWISRYPVTMANFQKFLAHSGYHPQGATDNSPGSTRPVTDITWLDALAYCDWLVTRSGLPVSLPSEAEWEKAARGPNGRTYPWGSQPPSPELCSFSHAVAVGQHSPDGDSPFGCADMAGNVWEWTRSQHRPYPYQASDGRESFAGSADRVVRGLTFNNPKEMTRSAYRYRVQPAVSLPALGFRVVVSSAAARQTHP